MEVIFTISVESNVLYLVSMWVN